MSVSEQLRQTIVNLGDPYSISLEPWPIPRGEWGPFVHGEPEYAGRWLYVSEDRKFGIALERLGPCRVTGSHGGEVCFYFEANTHASPPGGEPYRIRGGDLCFFPKGMADDWDVREPHLKLLIVESHGEGAELPATDSYFAQR